MKIEQKIITVRELVKDYSDNDEGGVRGYGGKLDIRPPYQREFVYKPEQRNKVIDSVEKGYPLNSMYWAVRDNGDFEIIDGQQRTVSLCRYIQGKFAVDDLFDNRESMYFHNLTPEEQKDILDYELTVYFCEGEKRELLKWFETINIAGEKLSDQELKNAVYSGSWVTDAKKHFSRINCLAHQIGGDYLAGAMNRQEYLETVLDWISKSEIEEPIKDKKKRIENYMGTHQNDEDAKPLRRYFEDVMDWVKATFPKYRAQMKGIAWGDLHRKFKDADLDAAALEKRVAALMKDEDVQKKSGIYEYVLTGDEWHLHLRAFSENQKAAAYERQNGKCVKCGESFKSEEMQGDHIKPWSKGGKTSDDNCQMLCRKCNQRKSDKS